MALNYATTRRSATEYNENFLWHIGYDRVGARNKETSGLLRVPPQSSRVAPTVTYCRETSPCPKPVPCVRRPNPCVPDCCRPGMCRPEPCKPNPCVPTLCCKPPMGSAADPTLFNSCTYPSVWRTGCVVKDCWGKYSDPYRYITNTANGRKLRYDRSHPEKMYDSQWNSNLATVPGPYSSPTTTGLPERFPWNQTVQWKADGEIGQWPTERWMYWSRVAECPKYYGFNDPPRRIKSA